MGDRELRLARDHSIGRGRKTAPYRVRHGSALPGAGFAGPDDGSGFGGGFAHGGSPQSGPSDNLKTILRHYASGGSVENFQTGALKEAAKVLPELLSSVFKRRPLVNPVRQDFPGIWADPRRIADVAESMVPPEDASMKHLFGYNRQELDEAFGNRVGNTSGSEFIGPPGKRFKTPPNIAQTMTPGNAQRLQDIIDETKKRPGLFAATNFYPLDPLYDRQRELLGDDLADEAFRRLNTVMG